jgi:GT2 family glycosyltransferase
MKTVTQLLPLREIEPCQHEGNLHVASIILNFNSDDDLYISVPQLYKQTGINHSLIIVDNASEKQCIQRTISWLLDFNERLVRGSLHEVEQWINSNKVDAQKGGCLFFVMNQKNSGYSAGNNIGIRLADLLNADAILIANPDMRIENPQYVKELSNHLFASERNYAAASRIVDINGNNQNPLRELYYYEELLWPVRYLKVWMGKVSCVTHPESDFPIFVEKVSGCCVMLKMSFMRSINYLDENIFMYCEESILSSRIHERAGRIVYIPTISALHSHTSRLKGDAGKRHRMFIESRMYYLRNNSNYALLPLLMLNISYFALGIFSRIYSLFYKIRQHV